MDVVKLYFDKVKNYKILTKQEEINLSQKIEKGDIAARDLMINSNLRLAISIAKKYQRSNIPFEELLQESNIGLIKAVDKFDWRKGYKFSTYATWWIRQAVSKYVSGENNVIRVPSHLNAIAMKYRRLNRDFEDLFGHDIPLADAADELGITEDNLKYAIEVAGLARIKSLSDPIGSEESSRCLGDTIMDNNNVPVDVRIDNDNIKLLLQSAICDLTDREEKVLRMRFGIFDDLDNDENYNLEVK
jgi:RNA polymerase primary sigma factor